jgi:hypothetical protein
MSEAVKKPLCFVIGPIGQEGTAERRHADLLLHTLVKLVLEAEELGYQVKRADEDADPGMIGDRMVTDIIQADLVVADLTDLNPNAFYELGIRHSTEKPTIHMAKAETKLPFDNVTHRTIFVDLTDWRSTENARAQLAASARAIKAPGYRVSNPITQANASFEMRESADPRDRVIANMQEKLLAIETRLNDGRLRGMPPGHYYILRKLAGKEGTPTFGPFTMSDVFRAQLRYLRDNGFIEVKGFIAKLPESGNELSDYVSVTPLGEELTRYR